MQLTSAVVLLHNTLNALKPFHVTENVIDTIPIQIQYLKCCSHQLTNSTSISVETSWAVSYKHRSDKSFIIGIKELSL